MARPGIRTVLLGLSLLLISLPVGGVVVLRIYESVLIRQTETGLITQSALIAAQYRQQLLEFAPVTVSSESFGRAVQTSPAVPQLSRTAGVEVDGTGNGPSAEQSRWKPRAAVLDLASSPLLPIAEDTGVDGVADEYSVRIGQALQPVLAEAQLTTLAGLRVVDFDGVVVATTGDDLGHYLGGTIEMQHALEGRGASVLRRREPEEPKPAWTSISRGANLRVHVTTPVLIGDRVVGAIQAIRTPATLGQALYSNRKLLTIGACTLLSLALLAWLLTSYAIVRPIKQLRSQSLRAVLGEAGAMTPLARPVTRDIDELSVALSTMAQSLQQRADYVRQFATHVSHEFKTPLTAMQGSIELLQDHFHTMTEQERARFLANLETDVVRLRTMVDELLKLTTMANRDNDHENSKLAVVLAEVGVSFATRDVKIATPDGPEEISISMSATAAVSVFSSLIDNAFDHGGTRVRIDIETDQDTVVFNLRDNGPGIAPENHERIFDALFTTRADRGGHGLGLAVVASLVRSRGGTIRSVPNNAGAHIQVRLPRENGKMTTIDAPSR